MDTEELKSRYKAFPIWGRLLGVALLGLLPAAYTWYDEGDALEARLVEAQGAETAARAEFETNRAKKQNMPKLEEQLEFTDTQLKKARLKLPDSFLIEDVLEKVGAIAKETGVKIVLFKPGVEARAGGDFKYVEKPIATELRGKFAQLMAFFDRVVHLEATIFIRNIELTPFSDAKPDGEEVRAQRLSAFETARRARADLLVAAHLDLVLFRGMTESEKSRAEADAAASAASAAAAAAKERKAKLAPVEGEPQAQNGTTVIGGDAKRRM